MEVKIQVLNPKIAADAWDLVWPLLSPAVDQGLNTDNSETILESVVKEQRILLLATVDGKIKGCSLLSFKDGLNRTLDIQFLGGKRIRDWSEQMNMAIDAVAKAEGCKSIIALGRKAWSRIWKDYKDTGKVLFVKEVA